MNKKPKKTASIPGPIKVNFQLSDFIPSVYSQHSLLQTGPDEVIISFFEANFPVMIVPTQQAIERVQKQGIDAECVARVVMSKNRFLEFAKAVAEIAKGIEESSNADNRSDQS